MKTCPSLRFYLDDSLKKSFEIGQLLGQVEDEQEVRAAESEQSKAGEGENER